ncbi:heparinase II/III family protein [uncultured Friedmanniella sp.]|uniref:heparinase II/III domain-containing protein n=1 Tax=uncultured Friedmanniella sp. TaxID=335381 RepID=UPI0035CB735B
MREPWRTPDAPTRYGSSRPRVRRWLAVLLTVTLLSSMLAARGPVVAWADDPTVPSDSTVPAAPTDPLAADALAVTSHPFLIVKKSEYAGLRARAKRYPWLGMKTQAAHDCAGLSYSSRATITAKGIRIRDIMGACSLMYVLDAKERPTYRRRMAVVLDAWPAVLKQMKREYPKSKNRWSQVVPPSSGYFNSVLALDVMHDDLSTSTLARYESTLDSVAEWYWAANRGWGTATYGARAIWATYQGDVRRRTLAAQQYHQQYLDWLTPDGAFKDGTEYALARNGGERTAKQGYLYVAEHTKVDPTYYADPTIQSFMEWLMGFAYGPFNGMVGFGDSGVLGRDLNTFKPETAVFAAGRFSPRAAASAARHITAGIDTMPDDLLSYSVTKAAPVTPSGPLSRAWPASGAAFWQQQSVSSDALMGAMWNPRITSAQVTAHMHREVNALYLAGYGEALLLNSGYNGYGKGALGASWSKIHSTASSSNTVVLGGANHLTAAGDGVTDYLTGNGLDYASGVGDRIYRGKAVHVRSFLMVQPQDKKNGYFLSLDDVRGAPADRSVDVYLHPASAAVTTVAPGREYRWSVERRKSTPTYLSIFLGTKPDRTTVSKAVIAGWDQSIVARSLDARFTTNSAGRRQVVTVLVPHDAKHAKPALARLSGSGYSGARVTQGAYRDYAVAAGGRTVSVGGATLTADAAVFRRHSGKTSFYFIRRGRAFDGGDGQGVIADHAVSVHMRGKSGSVAARVPSVVTFRRPGVSRVTVDGTRVPATAVAGGLTVTIPNGQHTIVLS